MKVGYSSESEKGSTSSTSLTFDVLEVDGRLLSLPRLSLPGHLTFDLEAIKMVTWALTWDATVNAIEHFDIGNTRLLIKSTQP